MGSPGQVDQAYFISKMCECWPTLEEVKDIEYVRQEASCNMFNGRAVMSRLNEIGAYAGINWLQRCKEQNFHPAVVYSHHIVALEREYGEMSTWLSKDERLDYQHRALNTQKAALERQLKDLETNQKELK